MVSPRITARLKKLEVQAALIRKPRDAEAGDRMELILSDPEAYELATTYGDTIEGLYAARPALNNLRDDFPALLSQLDDDTLILLERQLEALENRVDRLRHQIPRAGLQEAGA
jgi:hypothetical protein